MEEDNENRIRRRNRSRIEELEIIELGVNDEWLTFL